jgi:hypothetical protein
MESGTLIHNISLASNKYMEWCIITPAIEILEDLDSGAAMSYYKMAAVFATMVF